LFAAIAARFKLEDTAMVLIDHQVGTCSWINSIDQKTLLKNTVILAKFAAATGMPTVLTSSMETNVQGLLLPEIQEALSDAYEKRVKRVGVVNAWDDEAFTAAVRATGKRNLVMAGATTDVCLVPPATSAVLEGFNAVLDASGSQTVMEDQTAWKRMEKANVRLTTTNAIVSELVYNWATPAGQAGFGLLAPGS
ncbi:Isochorismatase-like hydrolases, partial [Klebsormidium nitens]